MRALTHITFGLLTTSGTFTLVAAPLHRDLPAAGAAVLGSLLPDIDSPHSVLGRLVPGLSAALERWRHRTVTHSLLALASLSLLSLPLGWTVPSAYAALLLGYASHLLADCATVSGVMLFWPIPRACVLPASARYRIEVGSLAESALLVVLLVLLALTLPISAAGGAWRALRYLLATQDGAYATYVETTTDALLDFRGRWRDTHQEVVAQAPILEGSDKDFIIAFQGRALRYGGLGDILPVRTRVRATDHPLRRQVLHVHSDDWPGLLERLPASAWVSGTLTADRPFVDQAAFTRNYSATPGSASDAATGPATPPRQAHTPSSIPGLTVSRSGLALVYVPRPQLARFRPVPRVDPEQAHRLARRVTQAERDLSALRVRRPPVHYLELRAAEQHVADLRAQRAALDQPTVRFTGALRLRLLEVHP